MKIIESYVRGKYDDPDQCEDAIVINDDYIAIIDGVTAKSQRKYAGKSSGRIAQEILKRKFSELPGNLKAAELLNALSEELRLFSKIHQCRGNEIPRACIIVYSRQSQMIIGYGDCQCYVGKRLYSFHKKIDQMNETVRSFVIDTALKLGSTPDEILEDDPGREAIQPYLDKQYLYENKNEPFGYAVLNGDPVNPSLITEIPVTSGTEIILASDGYPVLKDTLKDSENALHDLLKEDPLCFRTNPQTKGLRKGQVSYDDRSYIRFLAE